MFDFNDNYQQFSLEEMEGMNPEEKHLIFLFDELVAPAPVYWGE